MDGVHDLGGMHGFGPVEREADEPSSTPAWEAAVLAMMRAGGGAVSTISTSSVTASSG